ncbi:manganese efflux pump [Filibacter tadaridae]|uniref:Manganese efflux pump MntP n=1 Tax=Filibacter tadaridae TaxID=2483811 RepID=A0A3P5WTP0_9BACL|nr:manganese efflux pump [Filibacter tadaridae]VDC24988.1 manganese efflux pump MntP [Filibacter tadaridae]
MHLLTIIFIGVAANIDNLGISVAYGLRSNRIPFLYNLIISLISMGCAYFAITAGSLLSEYLTVFVANFIGGVLLVGLGIWIVLKVNTLPANLSKGKKVVTINWKESIVLGFILSLNCLTIGFGAGITGLPPLSTALVVGVFSFISILLGVRLGHKVGSTWFGKQAERIGGILLILIGIYEIFI